MVEYAKGKDSFFICQRSGFKTRQCDGVIEPGTGFMISKYESDKSFNLKDHPQNKPPKHRLENKPQRFALSGRYEAVINFLLDEYGDYLLDEDGNPIVIDI